MEKTCFDPLHVDAGPLSPGDFYASNGKICRDCHKRRSAVGNKLIQEKMKDKKAALGIVNDRRLEETPDEHDRKLRALMEKYSVNPEPRVVRENPFEPPPSWAGSTARYLRPTTLLHRNGLKRL